MLRFFKNKGEMTLKSIIKKKNRIILLAVLIAFSSLLFSCGKDYGLNKKSPITLTLWHNYGGQMKDTMDEMIDKFNETVGTDKGIIISVTSISGSSTLQEKLFMIANEEPGAEKMPDITTANPKTAIKLQEKGLLANLDNQFSTEEIERYVPRFIEEGVFSDKGLYVFPTAKSTEVLYLNKTIFDRFSMETGARFEDLSTFEGIKKTANLYYDWTDEKTPDIQNDGKTFFHSDSWFNLTTIGCKQLSTDFISQDKLDKSTQAFSRIENFFNESAVKGHFAIFDGYSSDLAKTGDIVCSTGSTAGVLFFSPTVTYADNTTESAEIIVLPYPTFDGGKKVAIQRGSGMVVAKSDESREYASSVFLKWFTAPENNIQFISSTGYLPVTKEAFGKVMDDEIQRVENTNIKVLLKTAIEMQESYDFYIPPVFDGFDALQKDYEKEIKQQALSDREKYLQLLQTQDKETAFLNINK